jgi:hypothetical protein
VPSSAERGRQGLFDLSGRNNNGEFEGTAPTWSAGKLGPQVDLGGSGNIELQGGPIYPGNTSYSVAAWVNIAGSQNGTIYGEGHAGFVDGEFRIHAFDNAFNDSCIAVYIQNDAGSVLLNKISNTEFIFDGQWHLIVWTDANGTAKLYYDGADEGTDYSYTRSGTFANITTADIGAVQRNTPTQRLTGAVGSVFTWNRVLNTSEILSLYTNPWALIAPRRFVPVVTAAAPGGIPRPVALYHQRHHNRAA